MLVFAWYGHELSGQDLRCSFYAFAFLSIYLNGQIYLKVHLFKCYLYTHIYIDTKVEIQTVDSGSIISQPFLSSENVCVASRFPAASREERTQRGLQAPSPQSASLRPRFTSGLLPTARGPPGRSRCGGAAADYPAWPVRALASRRPAASVQ